MAQKDYNTELAEMIELFSGAENPLLEMMGWLCRELMEVEVNQRTGAEKSSRGEGRTGYRSGYRSRRFDTRLGSLELKVPKLRKGGYVPFFVERRQRSEAALISVIQDIYINGVSTRKVKKLVEDMGIKHISAGEISNLTKGLDEQVEAFRNRSLKEHTYAILWVDALYEKVRVDNRVQSMAIEVVCGVNEEGMREVLAIEVMAEESKESYMELFRKLRERGMNVPKLVISDAHAGLRAAIMEGLSGCVWQRCKVHFMRNILAHIPQSARESVASALKQIWLQGTAEEARKTARAFIEKYGKKYAAAVNCLEEGLEDSLSFYSFETIDSKKIASSNMIERLNKEIRRRTKVVGIFPNESSYIRLVTAALMEYADDWSSGHVYIRKGALEAIITPHVPSDAMA